MAVVTTAVVSTLAVANSAYQGKKSRDAARDATRAQVAGTQEASERAQGAQDQFREDLAPFRAAGEVALPMLIDRATAEPVDRVAQLQQNPLFSVALNSRDRATLGAAANQGRIGTGDFSQQLSENFLLSASPLIEQQIQEEQIQENRLNNLLSVGQNSAAQTGSAELQTAKIQGGLDVGAADARSAGIVARNQATANQNTQIIEALPTIIGASNKGG